MINEFEKNLTPSYADEDEKVGINVAGGAEAEIQLPRPDLWLVR